MKLSFWIIPPEPLYTQLQTQIRDISQQSSGQCPSFIPHVTILGGIDVPSYNDASHIDDILLRLRSSFRGFGGIPCSFGPPQAKPPVAAILPTNNAPVFLVMNDDGTTQWNQSCVSSMIPSPEFIRAVKLTKSIFANDQNPKDGCIDFKPPLCEPHYSFAYGNESVELCEDIGEPPPNFVAQEATLWCTYPPSLEGVKYWKELGRVSFS